MYADKSAASGTVAGGAILAATGFDATMTIFLIVSAAVIIIAGVTLIRMFQASPKEIATGPQKRWSIRRK